MTYKSSLRNQLKHGVLQHNDGFHDKLEHVFLMERYKMHEHVLVINDALPSRGYLDLRFLVLE